MPPVKEQKAICEWITDECQPLDEAIARAEQESRLTREYRDRQSADVVTGQVGVRSWMPGPDHMVTEKDIEPDGEEDDGDT